MLSDLLKRARGSFGRVKLSVVAGPLVVLLTVAILSGVFIRAMLDANGRRWGAPIDDAYIYFNYARHLAQGHFFEYNPGDGVSTGATSWLWTVVLAVGYRLGFHGDAIMVWAIGLGIVFLAAYGLLLLRIGRRIFHHRALATILALLVLLDGRVLWGFFSGMEVGLFTLSMAATIECSMLYHARRSTARLAALVVSVSVLVLVRPEGQVLGAAAIAAIFLHKLLRRRQGSGILQAIRADRRAWLVAIVPAALIGLVYLTLYVSLGSVTQNGMRTKSHLFAPDQTLWPVVSDSLKFFKDMLLVHFPWSFGEVGQSLINVLVYTGLLVGAAREIWLRRPGVLLLASTWFVGGLLLQSVILNAAYHHGRYMMNYTFLYWLAFGAGLWRWLRSYGLPLPVRRLAAGSALALVTLLMVSTIPSFRKYYSDDIRDIGQQQVAMARYMRKNLPVNASVAMNDVGAGAYYSDRYIVDVWGLTTNKMALRKWEGQACILEELMHGIARRPDYFSIYPNWYPGIVKLGLLKPMKTFHVDPPHINGGDDMNLYSVDWSSTLDETIPHAAKGELDRAGVKVFDTIDIAYRASEIAHGAEYWRKHKPSRRGSELMKYMPYDGEETASLIDGGRTVRERESWTTKGLTPGRDLWIVRRTQGANGAAEVLVDGRAAGKWEPEPDVGGHYRDEIFKVPGDRITSPSARITFIPSSASITEKDEKDEDDGKARRARKTGKTGKTGKTAGLGYDVFYYWLAQ